MTYNNFDTIKRNCRQRRSTNEDILFISRFTITQNNLGICNLYYLKL